MSKYYPSQDINGYVKDSIFYDYKVNSSKTLHTYYQSERQAVRNMAKDIYGINTMNYNYVRLENGGKLQSYNMQTDERYRPTEMGRDINTNIAAYFENYPQGKLQIYIPDYDPKTGEPTDKVGTVHLMSFNADSGMYEISDEPIKNPDKAFLKDAQETYTQARKFISPSKRKDGYFKGVDPKGPDAEQLKEYSNYRYNYLHTEGFKEQEKERQERERLEEEQREREQKLREEAERQERINSGKAERDNEYVKQFLNRNKKYEEERNKQLREIQERERKEKEEREKYEREHKEEIEAQRKAEEEKRAREKAELEKKLAAEREEQERKAAQEKMEREKLEAEQKKAQEERQAELQRRRQEKLEKERIEQEERRLQEQAELQEKMELLKDTPTQFPAAKNYTLAIPEDEDEKDALNLPSVSNGNIDLVNHNVKDKLEMLSQMQYAVYGMDSGSRPINTQMFRNADGTAIKPKNVALKKEARFRNQTAKNMNEAVLGIFENDPFAKVQMYWPADNSMHYLSYDRNTMTYSISKESVPVPTDETARAEYNQYIAECSESLKNASLDAKAAARKNIKTQLADTDNRTRLQTIETERIKERDIETSNDWLSALKNNPIVKADSKSAEAEFILSCSDETAHGRIRIYEYAVSELCKVATEPRTKENADYLTELKNSASQLIANMKSDEYEPSFASMGDLNNMLRNVDKSDRAIRKSCAELSGMKTAQAMEKLCEIAYIDTVKRAKALGDTKQFDASLSEKSIKAGIKSMYKSMQSMIKANGGLENMIKSMDKDDPLTFASNLGSKFADHVKSLSNTKTKDNNKLKTTEKKVESTGMVKS